MDFETILEEYIIFHRSQCHTEKTVKNYEEVLNMFHKVVQLNDYGTITYQDVVKYQKYLSRKMLSPATVASYLRHIKAFVRWLDEYDYLQEKGWYSKIKLPKTPKKNVKIYTDSELTRIFDSTVSRTPLLTARNKLIISLMLDSGLRRNEVCLIKYSDIDFENCMLNVHGKGRKDRLVPIGSLTMQCLEEYRSLCQFESEFLLVDKSGSPLSNNAVKLFMAKMQKKLGFEFSSHKLRHNFATNYIIDHYDKYGYFDSYTLMVLLGHEEISTTERYVHYGKQVIASRERCSHLDRVFLESQKSVSKV